MIYKPRFNEILLILLLGGLCVGCAGPSTPLGAVWALTPNQARGGTLWGDTADISAPGDGSPIIRFSPDQQVLHSSSRMKILVSDPHSDFSEYSLAIRYNGMDVTRSFLGRSRIRVDNERLVVDYPHVRLHADSEHVIEVAYRNSIGGFARARYEAPVCYAFRPDPVEQVGDFSPSANTLKLIEKYSKLEGFNSAFATGLIAQESGFNPRALSWARALGLTQITPGAEQEVLQIFKDWPQYPGLNRLPLGWEKTLIVSRKVNAANEWRLNPDHSIQGGLEYAKILARRWGSPENSALIRSLFRDPELAYTQLILASYNSGYSRVSAALGRGGVNWLKDEDLTEARKYVNRISSMCHAFSNRMNEED